MGDYGIRFCTASVARRTLAFMFATIVFNIAYSRPNALNLVAESSQSAIEDWAVELVEPVQERSKYFVTREQMWNDLQTLLKYCRLKFGKIPQFSTNPAPTWMIDDPKARIMYYAYARQVPEEFFALTRKQVMEGTEFFRRQPYAILSNPRIEPFRLNDVPATTPVLFGATKSHRLIMAIDASGNFIRYERWSRPLPQEELFSP